MKGKHDTIDNIIQPSFYDTNIVKKKRGYDVVDRKIVWIWEMVNTNNTFTVKLLLLGETATYVFIEKGELKKNWSYRKLILQK